MSGIQALPMFLFEWALQKEAHFFERVGELYDERQVKGLGQPLPPPVLSAVAVLLLFVASFSVKTSPGLHTLILIQYCCVAGQGSRESPRVFARTGQSGLESRWGLP